MQKNKIKNSKYKITYKSISVNKFVNDCCEKNIEIFNVKKVSDSSLEFDIDEVNFFKLKMSKLCNVDNLKIIKYGGLKSLLNFLILRAGLLVGILICFITFMFLHNKIFYIKINSNNNILNSEVIKSLNEINIDILSNKPYNMTYIEEYLKKSHNLSMVSAITKGNALIINIKEELPNIENSYVPIVASENMVVKSIIVYAGTSLYKSGDLVKCGDVLVEPYYYENNEKIMIKPSAIIEYVSYVNYKENFYNVNTYKKRTGRSKVIDTKYCIGNKNLFSNCSTNDYYEYEIVEKEYSISKYFLPIKMKKIVAYELKEYTDTIDIDSNIENFKNLVKQKALMKLNSEVDINQVQQDIYVTTIDNGVSINCILTFDNILKYN